MEASGSWVEEYRMDTAQVTNVDFGPTGEEVATLVGCSKDVIVRSTSTGSKTRQISCEHEIRFMAMTSNGKSIITVGKDSTVEVWDFATCKRLKRLKSVSKSPLEQVILSPDGEFIITTGKDTNVHVWDLKTESLVTEFKGHTNQITCIRSDMRQTIGSINVDDILVISGSKDKSARVWKARTGELLITKKVEESVGCVALASVLNIGFCSAGSIIAGFMLEDGNLDLSSSMSSRNSKVYSMLCPCTVKCLATSRDGVYLFAGCGDNIIVWDWQHREKYCSLDTTGQVVSLAVNINNFVVASSNKDNNLGEMYLWCPPPPLRHICLSQVNVDGLVRSRYNPDVAVKVNGLIFQQWMSYGKDRDARELILKQKAIVEHETAVLRHTYIKKGKQLVQVLKQLEALDRDPVNVNCKEFNDAMNVNNNLQQTLDILQSEGKREKPDIAKIQQLTHKRSQLAEKCSSKCEEAEKEYDAKAECLQRIEEEVSNIYKTLEDYGWDRFEGASDEAAILQFLQIHHHLRLPQVSSQDVFRRLYGIDAEYECFEPAEYKRSLKQYFMKLGKLHQKTNGLLEWNDNIDNPLPEVSNNSKNALDQLQQEADYCAGLVIATGAKDLCRMSKIRNRYHEAIEAATVSLYYELEHRKELNSQNKRKINRNRNLAIEKRSRCRDILTKFDGATKLNTSIETLSENIANYMKNLQEISVFIKLEIFEEAQKQAQRIQLPQIRRQLKETLAKRRSQVYQLQALSGIFPELLSDLYPGLELQHLDETEVEFESKKPISDHTQFKLYKGTFNRQQVALKRFDLGDNLEHEAYDQELIIRSKVGPHPNIMPVDAIVLGMSKERKLTYQMMPWCGSTLAEWSNIQANRQVGRRQNVMKQIATGLQYLHQQEVIHKDLKPQNILVGDHHHVRITDFGDSKEKLMQNSATMTTRQVGTPAFRDPSLKDGGHASFETDIYSLGLCFYSMFERYPTPDQRGDPPSNIEEIPNMHLVSKLINGMITSEKQRRPSLLPNSEARFLLKDPFFKLTPKDESGTPEIQNAPWSFPDNLQFTATRDSQYVCEVIRRNEKWIPQGTPLEKRVRKLIDSQTALNDAISIQAVDSRRRNGFEQKVRDLSNRYTNYESGLCFGISPSDADDATKERCEASMKILREQYNPITFNEFERLEFWLAYHGTTKERARSIMDTGFAPNRKKTDKGYYGGGVVYCTFDLDTARQYGECVIICYVCTGNPFVVTDYSYAGKPLEQDRDAHIILVDSNGKLSNPPNAFRSIEIAVAESSQVLPRYLVEFPSRGKWLTEDEEPAIEPLVETNDGFVRVAP